MIITLKNLTKSITIVLLLFLSLNGFAQKEEFYHNLYDSMHDSPMQQKFRKLAPVPYGVVFLPWAGMTEEEMRDHFRTMKELGFTNLKQTMGTEEWPRPRNTSHCFGRRNYSVLVWRRRLGRHYP